MTVLFWILALWFSSAAVNVVLQNAQSVAGAVVSVKTFGALGDGVKDDTRAFQESIAQLNRSGGGTLMIPRGVYVITKTLNVGSHQSMLGDGVGLSVLVHKQGKGQSTIVCGSPNTSAESITFRDFSIRSTAAPDPPINSVQAGGIVLMNSLNATIERVAVDSSYIYGIWLWNVTDGRVLNCRINGVNYDGIAIQFCRNIALEHNGSSHNGYDGIIVSNNGSNTSSVASRKLETTEGILCSDNILDHEKVGFEIINARVDLRNNHISRTTAYAIGLMGGCNESNISANSIECSGGYGILVTGSGDGMQNPSFGCTVRANTIRGLQTEGIGLHFGGDHLITDNHITDCKQNGIMVYQSDHDTITGNTVDAAEYDGIKIAKSSHSIITDNVIKNSSYLNPGKYFAIELAPTCREIVVKNNIIVDTSHAFRQAIYYEASGAHRIEGNLVPRDH